MSDDRDVLGDSILPGPGSRAPDEEPALPSSDEPREAITADEVQRRALGVIVSTSLNSAARALQVHPDEVRLLELGVGAGPAGFGFLDLVTGLPTESYVGLYPRENDRVAAASVRHQDYTFRPGTLAEDDSDGQPALGIVDLSGSTWDAPAITSAHRALRPGGFMLLITPGIEGPGGAAVAEAACKAALRAGFDNARVAPLVGSGDAELVEQVLAAADTKSLGAVAAQLAGELALRSERYAASVFGTILKARWWIVFAIKRAPRIALPPGRPRILTP